MIASQAVVCLEGRREYLTRVLAIELELARRETVPSRRDAKLKLCALRSEELDALLCALDALRKMARLQGGGL